MLLIEGIAATVLPVATSSNPFDLSALREILASQLDYEKEFDAMSASVRHPQGHAEYPE